MHTDSTGGCIDKTKKAHDHCSFYGVEEEPLQREVKVFHSAYTVDGQ